MVRIAVVGAGIIGLSTACCVQLRFPDVEITVFGEKVSPNTTGDVAAGLWCPYLCGDNSQEDIIKWSGETYQHFLNLWNTPEGGQMGLTLMPCYKTSNNADLPVPFWDDIVLGFRQLSPPELKMLNKKDLRRGFVFTTIICECGKYLPALEQKFRASGGKLVQKRVDNLQDLGVEFDVVVNCSGIGAHSLVNDRAVFPIRGQIIRVRAPGAHNVILDESEDNGGYIIPNQDRIILGGTRQEHDWNLNPDDTDRKSIEDACFTLLPGLKTAPVLDHFVGLRPARPTVRLEMEIMESKTKASSVAGSRKSFVVVHNYGHGGSGITLSWGCALDACDLVEKGMEQLRSGLRVGHVRPGIGFTAGGRVRSKL